VNVWAQICIGDEHDCSEIGVEFKKPRVLAHWLQQHLLDHLSLHIKVGDGMPTCCSMAATGGRYARDYGFLRQIHGSSYQKVSMPAKGDKNNQGMIE
jgi:hypothetical protein